MKITFSGPAAGLACAACLAAGAVGTWAVQRHWPVAPGDSAGCCDGADDAKGTDAEAAEKVLAALPQAQRPSAVDQAIARASQKARQRPGDANAWAELGDALMQKARDTADVAYYAHAERAYRQALAADPKHVTATAGLAWVYGCRHEFEKSVEWADKALALDSRHPQAHGLLGDAAVEMGDYDAAFEHYQHMQDARPDAASYSRGAHLLFLTGDVRKATWLMGKAVAAGAPYAENTAWCRAQLALMHFHTGNVVAAEQLACAALEKAPNNYHLLAVMGKVLAARQDYVAAIACCKKASALAPQVEVLAALGDLYRLTGDDAEAEGQYRLVEAVYRLHKENGVRGDAQLALFFADHDRNLAEALRMAEEEYKIRKNVFVADTLAWCLYKNGRYEEAKAVVRKALARKTPDAGILFHAGMIHARLGDRVQAQLYLAQALSLNPNFNPVHAPTAAATLQELGAKPPETEAKQ